MGHVHPRYDEYRFCPLCATELETRHVDGSDRRCCGTCGFVHYRNPAVAAVVVVRDGSGRVLMVRRGPRASRAGHWSFPGGFVDEGEQVRAAAAREVREETGLDIDVRDLLGVTSNVEDPAKPVVVVSFAARVVGGELTPGDDAVDAAWFDPADAPALAFSTDEDLISRTRDHRTGTDHGATQPGDPARDT